MFIAVTYSVVTRRNVSPSPRAQGTMTLMFGPASNRRPQTHPSSASFEVHVGSYMESRIHTCDEPSGSTIAVVGSSNSTIAREPCRLVYIHAPLRSLPILHNFFIAFIGNLRVHSFSVKMSGMTQVNQIAALSVSGGDDATAASIATSLGLIYVLQVYMSVSLWNFSFEYLYR